MWLSSQLLMIAPIPQRMQSCIASVAQQRIAAIIMYLHWHYTFLFEFVLGRSRVGFASSLIPFVFHSLNALPMCVHYTSGSLSVARLSLTCWQNTFDNVSKTIILFPKWPIKTLDKRIEYHVTSVGLHCSPCACRLVSEKTPPVREIPIFAKYANITCSNINIIWQIGANI